MENNKEFAKYYDFFYQKKIYEKNLSFLINFIDLYKSVLDVGCKTGNHMSFLERRFCSVTGFDKEIEYLNIAKSKVKGKVFKSDIENFNSDEKYDVVIAMNNIFNHFTSLEDFEKNLIKLVSLLNEKGMLIIDLDNQRFTKSYEFNYDDGSSLIKDYEFDRKNYTNSLTCIYKTRDNIFKTNEFLKIFTISQIIEILDNNKLSYTFYENYTMKLATDYSESIQIVIKKED